MRRSTLTSAVAAMLAVAAIAPAGASAATRSQSSARSGDQAFAAITGQGARVHVAVKINRFVARASGPVAKGTATATLRSLGASPTTVHRKVTLAVTKKGRCNILTLRLNQLDLTLLGLNVHLDKVVLKVTGQRRGGILGRLFCSLAGARANLAKASRAAHRLNVRMTRRSMTPLSLTVPISAKTAQASNTCPILDLVLGPLHLNLLGLVIDLNRVHLTITAIRGGGLLGDLFCGLSTTPPPV